MKSCPRARVRQRIGERLAPRPCHAPLLLVAFLLVVGAVPALAAEPVDYARDIQPILARHCVRCHGPDEQNSDLRLDSAAGLLKGGLTGAAVVPGDSAASLLVQAISGADEDLKMPPEGDPLGGEEIALVKAWIDQGAKAPAEIASATSRPGRDHWSFQPVVRPRLPEVADLSWVRNPIDHFILARLQEQGINPSPEADRATLIRRLSFDLTGLPPSPEEVDAFLADTRGDAYERLVDRLLASPHYGERWGRHWLDLARYADSNGFTIDGPRSIWLYRDWVIDALNRDLPFDQFTIEQLAGDLLPEPSKAQLIATGFHRNTLINQEGGTDPEQFRVEAVVDRVNTTGAVFLGLTVGCAQCHTHKYDPISQQEYYELFAFFNNCDEPTMLAPTAEQAREHEGLKAELAAAEKALREHDTQAAARQPEWERQYLAGLGTWTVLDPSEFRSAGGAMITKLDDKSLLVGGDIPARDTYTLVAEAPLPAVTALRIEVLTHDTLPKRGPGLSEDGNFVLSELSVATVAEDGGEPQKVAIAAAYADAARADFAVERTFDGNPKTGWSVPVTPGQPNPERSAVFVLQQPASVPSGGRLVLGIEHQDELLRGSFGRFQVSVTGAAREQVALEEQLRAILALPPEQRSRQQQELLAAEFRKSDPARAPLAARVDELKQQERKLVGQISTTMIVRERATPRETHVHLRGDFLRKGIRVQPAVPEVLPPLGSHVEKPNRLDLARWLVDPANPLTPRVTVNRFWQRYFGRGLVETENDFGTQGATPTHPELLDWLASEFVAQGWSMKALHRLIVTSATYRQSSRPRADLAQVDPRNQLLARQNRLRLEAETIRDAALAASGLLARRIGGPGVFPPQPEGIYRFTQQNKQWRPSEGADRYRRGLYTYFWRSSPYPFLMTFDAPNGNVTCTRRVTSNTPLQALTLANDLALVELAQALASRVLREASQDERARIEYAFQLALARRPSAAEAQRLAQFLAGQREAFRQAAEAAKQAAPADCPAHIDPVEAAAWTALARVLMNVDEFVMRE